MAQNLYWLLSFLFIFSISLSNSFDFNNQVQFTRKLTQLRSYKDAQFFRFQIPSEISKAIFHLNASQSDLPINTTTLGVDHSLWNITHLSRSAPKPVKPIDTSPLPRWINTTKITIYTDKILRFYNSILSTACKKPLDVKFYLRWGSLPLLSIKNATIPRNFIFKNGSNQFEIDLKTDGRLVMLNLSNPLPGDWYGMAFINKTSDRISQKGLERECFYRFKSSVSFERMNSPQNKVAILIPSHTFYLKQSLVIDHQDIQPELLFKFFLNLQDYGVKIIITNCQFRASTNLRHHSTQISSSPSFHSSSLMNTEKILNSFNSSSNLLNVSCPIELNFRTLALPNTTNREFSFNCHSNNTNVELSNGKCAIDLPSYAPNQWNYLQIVPLINHMNKMIEQPVYESRVKLIYGSINFTIQLLAGQEAFLYNYYNDQNCQSTINQQSTSTMASIMPNTNLNFVAKNEASNNIYNSLYTTAASNVVSNAKVNFLSSNQIVNNLNFNTENLKKTAQSDVVESNKKSDDIMESETRERTLKTDKSVLLINRNFDSLEYNEEENEFAIDNSQNQLNKRSAEPPQGSNRDRKKSDRKTKEERRLKKQKNKNRQKNREKAMAEKQCQFEPTKIMATLDEDDLVNMTTFSIFNLTRYQTSDVFDFKYSHLEMSSNEINQPNITDLVFIEIDNDRYSLFNFTIIPQFDIGGNLVIDFAISPWTNNSQQNVSAILCLTHNKLPPIFSSSSGIRFDEYCYGYLVSNTSQTNYITMGSALQSLVVPYPQPGTWFVSILVKCYNNEDDTDDYNSMMNADFSTTSCDYSNKTSILIDIHSAACLNSKCMNNGKCQQYLNAGILYSTCSCRAGWKGLICNDGSEALSQHKLLINFLLLTISNAAFIPAIVLAACRQYFTESAIYFITMISSGLYHACDSDFSQSYCIFSVGLLQFADFYTAILSFFVTLLTLAYLSPACKSFFHLLGAILIALITQNDRTSLWTFVIPAGVGTLLLFLCWCSRCCRKSCYPPARCWIFSVCPALILTIVGLIIYVFLETQENYAVTHSIWHGIVALALFLAIPSMPPHNLPENEEDDDEHVHFMSSSSSSVGGSGKGTTKSNPETYYELIGEEKSHLARSHPQSVPANAQHITKTY